ncbi:MAG: AEC family transporter [Aquificaceae bacterium]
MLEIYIPLILGFILGLKKIFTKEDAKTLINFVIYLSLPALSFKTSSTIPINTQNIKIAICAYLTISLCVLTSYLVAKSMRLEKSDEKSFIVVSSFGNTAFLGFPLTISLLGESYLPYAVIYDGLGSFLAISTLGIMVLSGKPDLKTPLLFPPFIGFLLGIFLRPLGLYPVLSHLVEFLISPLMPVVLFALGLGLRFEPANLKLLAMALGIKILISPLFAFLIATALGLPATALKVCVLESSMPTMLTASALILKFGHNYQLAITSSTIGITLWLFILLII